MGKIPVRSTDSGHYNEPLHDLIGHPQSLIKAKSHKHAKTAHFCPEFQLFAAPPRRMAHIGSRAHFEAYGMMHPLEFLRNSSAVAYFINYGLKVDLL